MNRTLNNKRKNHALGIRFSVILEFSIYFYYAIIFFGLKCYLVIYEYCSKRNFPLIARLVKLRVRKKVSPLLVNSELNQHR